MSSGGADCYFWKIKTLGLFSILYQQTLKFWIRNTRLIFQRFAFVLFITVERPKQQVPVLKTKTPLFPVSQPHFNIWCMQRPSQRITSNIIILVGRQPRKAEKNAFIFLGRHLLSRTVNSYGFECGSHRNNLQGCVKQHRNVTNST